MKEHPIPQDVTGYRFHIVGNMTLGQFAQLAAGAGVAFVIYSTNLYDIIKWPLILGVFGFGALAAFVPIAERPISQWITTFFRILYKPTQFYWQREIKVPEFFNFVSTSAQTVVLPEVDLTPLRRQKIHEFIISSKTGVAPDEESVQIQQYVEHVSGLFASTKTVVVSQQSDVQKPKLKVRLRGMRQQSSTTTGVGAETEIIDSATMVMTDTQHADPNALDTSQITSVTEGVTEPIQETVVTVSPTTYRSDISLDAQAYTASVIAADTTTQEQAQDSAAQIAIPSEATPTITPTITTPISAQSATPTQESVMLQTTTLLPTTSNLQEESAQATFNTQLPFPSKPTVPNKLVGMVLSKNNELIEGAIVEIHAKDGSVARAVRSNALGQFFVTTPLTKGEYVITVEKPGFQFEQIKIDLKGKIIDPVEIRSM